jgi:membrane protein
MIALALQYIGIGDQGVTLLKLGRWPLLVLLLHFALAVLHRFGPSRKAPRWQWLSVGAVTASILWLAGSSIPSWYLANFGNYNATYGSLGAVIGLMMWFWMSAITILVGAELNSEIEHQAAVSPKDHAAHKSICAELNTRLSSRITPCLNKPSQGGVRQWSPHLFW